MDLCRSQILKHEIRNDRVIKLLVFTYTLAFILE